MRPMIKRISHRVRHRLGPFKEFLIRGLISGDVFLGNAIRSHRPPFVMVAFKPQFAYVPESVVAQPYLRKILELVILRYLPGIQMAMVINDGHLRRMLVI